MNLRVVVVHNRYRSGQPSGENRAVEADIAELRRSGVSVRTYIRTSDEIDGSGAFALAGLGIQSVISPTDSVTFARLLETFRPHLIHIHNLQPLISHNVVRVARRRGIPILQTVHNYRLTCANGTHFRAGAPCLLCTNSRLSFPAVRHGCYQGSSLATAPVVLSQHVYRSTLTDLDRYIAVGDEVRRHLINSGVPGERIVVRRNPVSDPGPPSALGRDVVFVGRLSEEKGVDLLLKAWRLVPNSGARLQIAGDGPLRRDVELACASDESINYLGLVGEEELSEVYRNAAVVVAPALWREPDGLVVATAMGFGRPVITCQGSSGVGGAENDHGWTCDSDPLELARVIGAALGDRAQLRKRAAAARATFVDVRVKSPPTLVDIYRNLLLEAENNIRPRQRDDEGEDDEMSHWIRPFLVPKRVNLTVPLDQPLRAATLPYDPQRRLSSSGLRLGLTLARFGIGTRSEAPQVPVDEIAMAADIAFDGWASIRSSTAGRSVASLYRNGAVEAVVKCGEINDTGLRHEAGFLAQNVSLDPLLTIPELLYAGEVGGRYALVTRGIQFSHRSGPSLVEAEKVIAGFASGATLGVPATHGDAAPWNMRMTGSGIAVLDWETVIPETWIMHDLCHFVIQSGGLLNRWGPREAVRMLCAPDSTGARHLRRFGIEEQEAPAFVGRYCRAVSAAASQHLNRYRLRCLRWLETDWGCAG